MSYQALYRKYRPRRFEDVIGQEHITTILKNQVRTGHIAHAYLFCGTRGTGKTSTAKILARAINCENARETGEPCGECESCRRTLDEDVDIVELDAASNNGVEEMRALLEKAQFLPLNLKTKVYIIDEAHALTGHSFNALLKTLEEPPAHVVFMFATTEPQKLPATIISRCQRYDFHRLKISDMVATLRKILKDVGARIDDEGLEVIARAADGGMRDALSLTDQCLAFCGSNVKASDVYDVLGSMEQGTLFSLADEMMNGDAAAALKTVERVVFGGRDLGVFARDMAQHMRALMLAKTCGDCSDMLDCTQDAMQRYSAQAERASEAFLLNAMESFVRVQSEMKYLSLPRVLLESTVVRLCRPEEERTVLALEERVEKLEKMLKEGGAQKPVQAAPAAVPKKETIARETAQTAKTEPEKPVKAEPEKQASASGDICKQFLNRLQQKNLPLYILARDAAPLVLEQTLFLQFRNAQASHIAALTVPKNLEVLCATLKEVAPELSLQVGEMKDAPSVDRAEMERRAKVVFGDKLTIED